MGKRLSGSQAMKKAVKKSSKERKAWVLAHPPAVNVARYDQKAIKTILIVGDGDFSFALGLVQHRGSGAGVTATSFDSAVAQSKKYAGVQARVASLKEAGCAVEFGVDARALSKLTEKLETKKFDRIVFNFPFVRASLKQTWRAREGHCVRVNDSEIVFGHRHRGQSASQ